MKKYILFGAGNFGRDALLQIGSENIECFCDNNKEILGTKRFDKTIISFEKLKEVFNDYIVVICASFEKSYIMANQLEENNISDYVPYSMFRYFDCNSDYWSRLAEDNIERLNVKCQFYRNKSNDLDAQVNYFKFHSDIRTMKPATGKLREHQLDEINAVREFNNVFESINVQPFLGAGNLLGYVRHNGFIPWDDDMDLYLIRDEFERLKKYCFDNFQVMRSESRECSSDEISKFYSEHPDEWCVWECHTHFQLVKVNLKRNDSVGIDFFVMDYYDDNYSYIEHRKYLNELHMQIIQLEKETERIKFIKNELKNNKYIVKKSNLLYMGIDNMDSYILYDKGEWISNDIVFPLSRVQYEGVMVWIPNKPEEFLKYQFNNIYDFPNDVGLQKHIRYEQN